MRVVDAQYANIPGHDIDFVDAARILCNPPVRRQWLIEKLEQQCAVHTVMADEDNSVIDVVREDEPQCVRGSSHQVLK